MDNFSMQSPQQTQQQASGNTSFGARKRSRQQQMMDERMPQQGQQKVDPVVQTQGATYNPTPVGVQPPQPIRKPAEAQSQAQPIQQTNSNNTTRDEPKFAKQEAQNKQVEKSSNKEKKEKTGNKKIIIIVIVILLVLAGGYLLLKYMDNKEPEVFYDPMEDPEIEWIQPSPTPAFSYSLAEVEQLRQAGYTGYEIDDYQKAQYDVNYLIELATAKRDAWVQEAIAPLYDMASPEYKKSIESTWLALDKREDIDIYNDNIMVYKDRRNLDYEKIEVHGTQIFIKVYFDDNLHENFFFVQVTPQEYAKLNDTGNIIVNYTYQHAWKLNPSTNLYEEDKSNFFIIDASIEII